MPTVHYANHNFLKQNNLRIDWSIDDNGLDRSASSSFVDENRISVNNNKVKFTAKKKLTKQKNYDNQLTKGRSLPLSEGKKSKPTAKDSTNIRCSGGYSSQKQLDSSSSHRNVIRKYPAGLDSASNHKRKEIVKGGFQERKRQRSGYLLPPTPDQSKAYSNSNTPQKMPSGDFNNDNTTLDKKSWPLHGIEEPGNNDCLVGRGGGTNHHPGNKRYRQIIADNRATYKGLPRRSDKANLAMKIVQDWRAQDPPGRFLKINEETRLWDDVGDELARVKVSQSLREKSTEKKGNKKREEVVSISTVSRSRSDSTSARGTTQIEQQQQQPTASDHEVHDAYSNCESDDDDLHEGGVDTSKSKRRGKYKSFGWQRLEDLKAYQREHGHVNVKLSEDKSLYQFCASAKHSLLHPEKSTTMADEKIASLSSLGFTWAKQAYNKNKSASDKQNICDEEAMEEEQAETESAEIEVMDDKEPAPLLKEADAPALEELDSSDAAKTEGESAGSEMGEQPASASASEETESNIWKCPSCTFDCPSTVKKCTMCEAKNPQPARKKGLLDSWMQAVKDAYDKALG